MESSARGASVGPSSGGVATTVNGVAAEQWRSEPAAVDSAHLPVDTVNDIVNDMPPGPSRGAYLTLLVALLLEATVPSLQCYWGVLLVLWPVQGTAAAEAAVTSLQTLRATGMLWTPVLFSATWSVTDPWSETLCTVHGHTRLCSLIGAVLLGGGTLLTAVGAVLSPHSALLPLLAGLSAGIIAGMGASMLSRSSRLVLVQRWGARAPLAQGLVRFARALGLTMAPLVALALGQRFGPAGALVLAAGVALHALLAPSVFKLTRARPQQQSVKYNRLQRLGPAQLDAEADAEMQTESSDDGGSVSGSVSDHPAARSPPSNPGPSDHSEGKAVVAEVHFDESGQPQAQLAQLQGPYEVQPTRATNYPSISPEATARLSTARVPSTTAYAAPYGLEDGVNLHDPGAPRPLYGDDGQPWNIAYSFDCDGDDDIELFVKKLSPRRGVAAVRICRGLVVGCGRGCRADLRPLLRPSFHLSLWTLSCCRLAGLALPVLLPALAVAKLGVRARIHLMAALPAVAGVGGMLFGLAMHMEVAADPSRVRRRTRLLSVTCGVAAAGFTVLCWGQSQWWLMLGALSAGYGCSGASWAQRHAARDAMGGATWYRAQPLQSFFTGIILVLAAVLCDVEIPICMVIIAAMFAVLSVLWLVQPFVARLC